MQGALRACDGVVLSESVTLSFRSVFGTGRLDWPLVLVFSDYREKADVTLLGKQRSLPLDPLRFSRLPSGLF